LPLLFRCFNNMKLLLNVFYFHCLILYSTYLFIVPTHFYIEYTFSSNKRILKKKHRYTDKIIRLIDGLYRIVCRHNKFNTILNVFEILFYFNVPNTFILTRYRYLKGIIYFICTQILVYLISILFVLYHFNYLTIVLNLNYVYTSISYVIF